MFTCVSRKVSGICKFKLNNNKRKTKWQSKSHNVEVEVVKTEDKDYLPNNVLNHNYNIINIDS